MELYSLKKDSVTIFSCIIDVVNGVVVVFIMFI